MNKKIALITGANKGIGFTLAKKLAENNYSVWIGCRNSELGEKAELELKSKGLDVKFVSLDVTNQETINKAVQTVEEKSGRLDLLVNNAGIYAHEIDGKVSTLNLESFHQTFDVNLYGVVRVTQAFLPLIKKSTQGKIYNISSGLGSLNLLLDTSSRGLSQIQVAAYSASKAALNVVTALLSTELKDSHIMVNSLCPGHTATDLNGHNGPQTVEESVEGLYSVISREDFISGHFLRHEGGEHPW